MPARRRKPTIFVTRQLPPAGVVELRRKYSVRQRQQESVISRQELLAGVATADALLCDLTARIDDAVMAAAPRLKVVANFAVGFDNIDLAAATRRGIVVTNTPGVLDEAVAEHALALMLAVSRRIVEADRFARSGKFTAWMPLGFLGPSLQGKTLGVVGLGRIGSTLAEMAHHGLKMKVVYTDLHRNAALEKAVQARFMPLRRLLAAADVVSVHVPLLPATRHLIDTKELQLMKKSAILINTARGPVVSEKALLRALTSGTIRGAGLDVFECEPALDCDPSDRLQLVALPNVVLTPHIASATDEARAAMSRLAARNISSVLAGRKPPALVNPDVWPTRRR
jgi:glyoxylate reductase